MLNNYFEDQLSRQPGIVTESSTRVINNEVDYFGKPYKIGDIELFVALRTETTIIVVKMSDSSIPTLLNEYEFEKFFTTIPLFKLKDK